MMPAILVLKVHADGSVVRFLCHLPGGQAVKLESLAQGQFTSVTTAPSNGAEVALDAGTYVLRGGPSYGVGCQVVSGSVSVIVPTDGGEDPWPDLTGATGRMPSDLNKWVMS
jgi:hypothetical protein